MKIKSLPRFAGLTSMLAASHHASLPALFAFTLLLAGTHSGSAQNFAVENGDYADTANWSTGVIPGDNNNNTGNLSLSRYS